MVKITREPSRPRCPPAGREQPKEVEVRGPSALDARYHATDRMMSLSDFPFERYPRTWGEMSYDFKLMFFYHGTMMVLFAAGQTLSLATDVIIAVVVLSACVVLAVRHRRRTPWVWRGISLSRLLGAAATVLLGGLFLSAAVPLFP